MKKKITKVDKTLKIDKETIAKLNEEQLGNVEGGLTNPVGSATCNTKSAEAAEEDALASCLACSCNG